MAVDRSEKIALYFGIGTIEGCPESPAWNITQELPGNIPGVLPQADGVELRWGGLWAHSPHSLAPATGKLVLSG
jgi:hypothetical protein